MGHPLTGHLSLQGGEREPQNISRDAASLKMGWDQGAAHCVVELAQSRGATGAGHPTWALAVMSSRSWGVMGPSTSVWSLSQGSWSPGPSL